ncbi:MAG: replication-relaxation family protein [Phenylobacterium sp.]|uniref:replication-relaxation family protein n=1 Tax=Phenylobacterium sp. TaxID=1871053 RepID=UPI002732E52B|nr:replication-relaxation family protein [Phenylobacterium sp.]MDP3749375.1 replication-relaxation family protein [Phenylobacterium sp.]
MTAQRKSVPRFKRLAEAPRIELTDDDIEILRHVYRHRFVRADDLYRLFPGRSPDKLSRRLVRLYRTHYLDRPIAQVDRFREGGSQPMVYGLDNAGARFLAETLGLRLASGEWKARNRSYTRENLDHTLAITRFMVDLELACRARPDIELIPFEEIVAAAPDTTRRLAQPGRWSVAVEWLHGSGEVLVVPDAIFGLRHTQSDGRKVRSFVFLEIDRGTMTIVPSKHVRESAAFLHRATILRKLLTYATSHRAKLHQLHLGIAVARVLTVTTSAARAEAMRQAAHRLIVQPMGLPAGLFLFGGQAEADNPLSASWLGAGGHPASLAPDLVTQHLKSP